MPDQTAAIVDVCQAIECKSGCFDRPRLILTVPQRQPPPSRQGRQNDFMNRLVLRVTKAVAMKLRDELATGGDAGSQVGR